MELTPVILIDRQQFSKQCNLIMFLSFFLPSLFSKTFTGVAKQDLPSIKSLFA
jgi:hypothetical protein